MRSVITHSNIATNNNFAINNNNVQASGFSGGISNQAIQPQPQPLSGLNTITASNANVNITRSLNTPPNIATNNNSTINNNVLVSEFSGGISNQAIQPPSGTNTITRNPNFNIFRPLNMRPNIATNNLTINNNNNNNNNKNVHSEIQEAQFVKTQFNKILSKFFPNSNIFVRFLFEQNYRKLRKENA